MDITETLNLHQTAIAVAACARAGVVPLVIGAPGIGKTSLGRAITPMIARAMGYDDEHYKLAVCILSNREAVDVGGYPVIKSDDTVELKLFGTLAEAAAHPRCLLLDEFLTCPQSVQGPALRLTLERVAGETPLHEATRIIAMANPPDHAPGGIQLTAALVNRLVILNCVPSVAEVSAFFCSEPSANLTLDLELPDDAAFAETKAQLMDTLGILFGQRSDLLCFDPPPASISGGEPFGSPRAWEMCCSVLAALPPGHLSGMSDVTRALTLGAVGPAVGIPFLSILRAKTYLPSVADVLRDPEHAKLPDEDAMIDVNGKAVRIGRDVTFAAIPLVIEAARTDTYAAFVYVAKLPVEIQAAVAKTMASRLRTPPKGSPWTVKGQQTLLEITRRMSQGPGAREAAKKVKKAS